VPLLRSLELAGAYIQPPPCTTHYSFRRVGYSCKLPTSTQIEGSQRSPTRPVVVDVSPKFGERHGSPPHVVRTIRATLSAAYVRLTGACILSTLYIVRLCGVGFLAQPCQGTPNVLRPQLLVRNIRTCHPSAAHAWQVHASQAQTIAWARPEP
jgi:hypothetical protein